MNVSDTRSSLKKVQFEESKFDNFLKRHKMMKKINLEHKYF